MIDHPAGSGYNRRHMWDPLVVSTDSPRAPDDTFVRQRWIPHRRKQWARECDEIMVEYGAVTGSTRYPKRHLARYRAQSLIRLMVELRLHERWELSEHTDEMPDGSWTWTVEYVRRNDD